jgi:5-methylcytosine-specific restriction endonuclease McrA
MTAAKSKTFRYYATEQFGRCQWCNVELRVEESTIDHIVPLSLGGTHAWANLALACGPCNRDKGTNDWGNPRFGPHPWTPPRARGRRKRTKVRRVRPINLWPATLTHPLRIPLPPE